MNEEDMKAFVESYTNTKMNDYEWDSYQKEEDIHKNLYNEIYEEVMNNGMDNETYPKMFSVLGYGITFERTDEKIFTFAQQGNNMPDIFCNGDLWSHSFQNIEETRDFYVRLCNSGYEEYTEPVRGVYAYYRNKGMGPKLGNNAYGTKNYNYGGDCDYAIEA